jgi:proton glutamate symport protein
MVPDNAIKAMSDNTLMLQVIFFTIFIGLSMLLLPENEAKPLKEFFDSLNSVVLKMVDLIMLLAPMAVFSLLTAVIVTTNDVNILFALIKYAGVVVMGLLLMIFFYVLIISLYVKKSPIWFLKEIAPAQLLAFSTSSSAATLPVTMERVEEHLGVDKEVSSFVLPVGATINMDGTSLYQAVAAVFILQVLWPEGLSFSNQLIIVLTALLASIGSAAIPGAGMVMLVIVLDAIGFPKDMLPIGLALIFAVDRPLDMLRTTVNVTGDACVAMLIAKSEGKLGHPNVKNWDDNYPGIQSN